MDAVSDPSVTAIVAMTSAQIGKTEILNNIVGFHVDQDPAPILVMQPTLEMAEAWSKDRLAPMLRDTPALAGRVRDARTRDSGNTLLHKTFPGGHISMAGANSAAGLASRPIRILLCDEVDRYPHSAGTEGDPISLARKRTTTFWNRKIILTSTPTVKGLSRIEAAWELSDKRRFFLPCPHCGEMQHLVWAQVKWPDGRPAEAEYHCCECGAAWSEHQRIKAIAKGEWRPTATGNGATAGFHLNEMYSPWSKLGDIATAFLEAKRSPETLKVWINTALGELWDDDAERLDQHDLAQRAEDWGDAAPDGVLVVTCGVDTQDDRLEVERIGWGPGEESWSLEHKIIYGDPSAPEIWKELDAYLLTPTIRCDGRELPVQAACIDSGGHHTQAVYRFCRERFRRRVYAIKGASTPGKPLWPVRASKNNKVGAHVFLLGTEAGKDAVYARFRIAEPGPGYCHIPKGRDPEWFEQVTSNVVQVKYSRGFAQRVYFKPPGKRDEALDCRVYGYAALQGLNVRWGRLLELDARNAVRRPPAEETDSEFAAPAAAGPSPAAGSGAARKRRVRRSTWMS